MTERKYSVILGNLGNTCDRFCKSYKDNPDSKTMLRRAAAIPLVKGIELVGTWDVTPENATEMKRILDDLEIETVSIIPDLFTDKTFMRGSYSAKDARVRRAAIDYTRRMADVAGQMNCRILNIWPGQDGYDYLLTSAYDFEREWLCMAIRELGESYPEIRFALEYKAKEPRTHSYLARMADTLLLAQETGCSNVGITIDTGHAYVGGEVVAESIVLAKRAGDLLFHMHFNDNFGSWDDDMIVGSVHSVAYLEMLYWLDRCQYDGWLSMDQYPYREDAAGAIGESILWLNQFDAAQRQHKRRIDHLLELGDPVETSRFLRGLITGTGDDSEGGRDHASLRADAAHVHAAEPRR